MLNIACHVVQDLYENKFDRAYLISGDSDLLLPIKMCRRQGKEIIAVFPPQRCHTELIRAATGYKLLKKKRLENCLLPNPAGRKLYMPREWVK